MRRLTVIAIVFTFSAMSAAGQAPGKATAPGRASGSGQASNHISQTEWWTKRGKVFNGPIKLVTPIADKEGNMFRIEIVGYDYHHSNPFSVECTGYVHTPKGLLRQSCRAAGTDRPIRMVTEERGRKQVVTLVLGDDGSSWHWPNLSFEYVGWKAKNASDFEWVTGEKTPPGPNFNNVVEDDDAGFMRVLDHPFDVSGKGAGLEMAYDNRGVILSFDRDENAYRDLEIRGRKISLWSDGQERVVMYPEGTMSIGGPATPKEWEQLVVNGNAFATHFTARDIPPDLRTPALPGLHLQTRGRDGYPGFMWSFYTAAGGGGFDYVDPNELAVVEWYASSRKWKRFSVQPSGRVEPKLVRIDGFGNLGIGVQPQKALDVAGDVRVSGGASFGGVVTAANIAATSQDIAEWVPSNETLSAGTVVIVDPESANRVVASDAVYDTRVAGVISENPGLVLGEESEGRVMVATTGRVRVRASAINGAIRIGDLLVTSDQRGIAMKSVPIDLGGASIHRPGTLIGKALEPLDEGEGEILVLLSLQ